MQVGLQGLGPLPYRLEDRVRERNSLRQRIGFLTLTNRSLYFGYDLYTIVGHAARQTCATTTSSGRAPTATVGPSFVRTLVGFTEYGRAI